MSFKLSDLRLKQYRRGISWPEALGLAATGCGAVFAADWLLDDPAELVVTIAIAAAFLLAVRLLVNRSPVRNEP